MFTPEVSKLANVVWNYHHMRHPLQKADVMLVLGSHDLRVAAYAARLYVEGYAPRIIVSGGSAHEDDLLRTGWSKTEAEMFFDVLIEHGVPEDRIALETSAKNTGENFALSKRMLEAMGVSFQSVLVVTKPYMERRAFATGAKQWPDKDIIIASPPLSFEAYIEGYANDERTSPEDILNIMVGDLERIDAYGRNGFQIPQVIPPEVWNAFERLKELGYTKHLIDRG